jgi:ribonuclease J
LRIPDGRLVDIEAIDDYPPSRVCVISTGSQGEPMSALALLAAGTNRWLKVSEQDTVVLSSHAIPGNEFNVNRVIDGLLRSGADVVHSGIADVHASGHAQADDLKTLLAVARPEWFVPIHGEYRHLLAHAKLATLMGVRRDHVLDCSDGDTITISDDGVALTGRVPAGLLYVDGIVGDVGQGVLRDRRLLADEGVVVVVLAVDTLSGKVITGPEIITRGWVYAPEADALLDEGEARVADAVEAAFAAGTRDIELLEQEVRRTVGRFVSERTRRRPMIVPVVMEA